MAPSLTPFARKYGVLPPELDPNNLFHPFSKSGWSPTAARTILTTASEERRYQRIETYQRDYLLSGLNARELEDLGALPDPEARLVSNLSCLINPMFHYTHWETPQNIKPGRIILPITHSGYPYSFGPTNIGLWTVANPPIWEALKPVLRLVSRFFTNIHTSTWIDAFLYGEFRELPDHLDGRDEEEKRKNPPLHTFYRREPWTRNREHILRGKKEMFRLLENKINFGIGSPSVDVELNSEARDPQKVDWHGVTLWDPDYATSNNVFVYLNLENILPLLRIDLSPSEIFAERFFVANILLHEFCHAINRGLHSDNHHRHLNIYEPYFENEIYAELGSSFETSLYGGTVNSFIYNNTFAPRPHLGFWVETCPYWGDRSTYFQPIIGGNAAISNLVHMVPFPAKHFENLQSASFWEYAVQKWGLDMVKPDTGGFCSTLRLTDDGNIESYHVNNPISSIWKDDVRQVDHRLRSVIKMTKSEREAYAVAKKLDIQSKLIQEQRKFRRYRQDTVTAIFKAQSNLHKAKQNGNSHMVITAQESLLNLYTTEAQNQATEIIKFIEIANSDNSNRQAHYNFLATLNRHLRELLLAFKDENYSTDLQIRLERINGFLNGGSVLLRWASGALTLPGFSLAKFKGDFDAICSTAVETTPSAALPEAMDIDAAKLREIELDQTVARGRNAVTRHDKDLCNEIGRKLLFDSLFDEQYRGIGYVLLAHGSSKKQKLWRDGAAYRGITALRNAQRKNSDEDYSFWLRIAEDMVEVAPRKKREAPEELSTPCAKKQKLVRSVWTTEVEKVIRRFSRTR